MDHPRALCTSPYQYSSRRRILYHSSSETDINQVLQSTEVFTNISKGVLAKNSELLEAFDTTDRELICRLILMRGELQVTEAERKRDLEMRQREIISFVVNMCINYETRLPFPARMIEKAMQRVHFAVHPTKSTKQQALELVRLLKEDGTLPIERAQMRIRVSVTDKSWTARGTRPSVAAKKSIAPLWTALESEDLSDGFEAVMLIPPSNYRLIMDLIRETSNGTGIVEIIDAKVDESDMHALDAIASGMGENASLTATQSHREEKKGAKQQDGEMMGPHLPDGDADSSNIIPEGAEEDDDDDSDDYDDALAYLRHGNDYEYSDDHSGDEGNDHEAGNADASVGTTASKGSRVFPDHRPSALFPPSKVVYQFNGLSWSIGGDSSDEDYAG